MRWRFVDKIITYSPWRSILTVKAGSLEEYGLLERWGEPGQSPAILLLESCIQSTRWLVEASSGFASTLDPLDITHWRTMEGLKPGERLCSFVWMEERSGDQAHFAARQWRLAPGEAIGSQSRMRDNAPHTPADQAGTPDILFAARLAPLAERYIPADREILWREVCA